MTPPPFIYSRIPGLLKLVSLGHLNFSMRGRIHLLLRVIMAVFSLLQNGTGLSLGQSQLGSVAPGWDQRSY